MPKYPGISPYDNEKGTLGTAKKRWEKLYVKEIESDTVSGINATIENLATTAENSVANAVAAKNAAVDAKVAAETAAETAATAAAGIQSVVETDVDNTLSIAGVAADAKVTGDWLRDIAKPVTLDTSLPETAYADEYMKVTVDSEGRVLYGVKRDGTFTWQKGVPKHLQDKINELSAPTIDNDEYMYVMLDSEGHVLFGVKRDGSFDWQKGLPKPVREKLEEVAQTVIQSEEYVQLTQDADGKLIEGITTKGTKMFMSTVEFKGDVKFDKSLPIVEFSHNDYSKSAVTSALTTGLTTFYLDGDISNMTKDNKVNLSYRYENVSGTCTCKWQGASSSAYPKKNFSLAKISPQIDVGWGNQKKYVLKANFIDFSHARNIVSARLWGEIVRTREPENVRLLATPNCGAVDGFPVMLVINGEYQGLYTLNIPKDQWMLNMGSGSREAMITAENRSATTYFKALTTKEDVLAEKDWAIEYVPDEDDPDWAINSLNTLIGAVIDSTGTNYRSTLESYLDIESAIDYYIFQCLIGGYDGEGRNFILGTYNGAKWFFNAYDLDSTFGNEWTGNGYRSPKTCTPTFNSFNRLSRVMHLIYTYDRGALKARYAEIRNSVMAEENVLNHFTNYMKDIPKGLLDEEVRLWPMLPGTNTNNLSQIMNWYKTRLSYIDSEIAEL